MSRRVDANNSTLKITNVIPGFKQDIITAAQDEGRDVSSFIKSEMKKVIVQKKKEKEDHNAKR